jgi:prepilin-type N-terminal cleavage/methylation domain-containing protein
MMRTKGIKDGKRRGAFTLLEIMVVVGVMAIILAAGVPTLWKVLKKEGFRKTMNDVREVCEAARAQAIMKGQVTRVKFHPHDGTCEVEGASGPSGGLARSANFGNATLDMLDINLTECKDFTSPTVRFYSNGTCDEMTLILTSDRGQQLGITLDNATAVASIMNERDLQNLRNGRR